jgi:hypothetical protein
VLPAAQGDALIVVGLEGCLDMLTPEDAEQWLREDFKSYVLRFQSEYENQAGFTQAQTRLLRHDGKTDGLCGFGQLGIVTDEYTVFRLLAAPNERRRELKRIQRP